MLKNENFQGSKTKKFLRKYREQRINFRWADETIPHKSHLLF
jgi:hypothetical protein